MTPTFLEVILTSADMEACGFDGRDQIEDPLNEALISAGLGEVTGGGSGMGASNIDIDLDPAEDFLEALLLIKVTLRELGVPKSTEIVQHQPFSYSHQVYDDE